MIVIAYPRGETYFHLSTNHLDRVLVTIDLDDLFALLYNRTVCVFVCAGLFLGFIRLSEQREIF